jgi:hypothetical protein
MTLMGKQTRLLLLWAFLGGCASSPALPIKSVAGADLACAQVSVSEVADNRYQAVGCGKTGTYAKLCSGRNCSWVRVRSAAELAEQSSGGYASPSYGQPREIIQAPPPAQPREIVQAPLPAQPQQREIIPAPPPEQQAAAQDPNVQQNLTQSSYTPQPTPLAQGDLSQPYQTEVPAEPTAQRVQYAPPAPLVEQQPPPPQPNYQWINGYWWWGNPSWTWVPGYWCPPRYGYTYVGSSWYWSNGYWWFGTGGWARPGSTIIVASPGPRPSRYVTSRSFTPHYVSSSGGRMSAGPAHAPAHFTPQSSPLYRYPTSSSQRVGRMSASHGPAGATGYNSGLSSSHAGRFGAGSATTSHYNGSPARMNASPAAPSSSSYRAPQMHRMGGSSGGSSGGSFGRSGGGGAGFGRMGGGGGGGGPHHSAGGGHHHH